jgi:hypothetical protein
MTASVGQSTDFWNSLFPQPQPNQDAELLQQVGFIPGLKELLMVRQVHALEHATVWILSGANNRLSIDRADDDSLGGLSTEQGFYLYGQVNTQQVQRAVQEALRRVTHGEWDLAIHPRCGTNVSVGMMLTASLALGFHLISPRDPIGQILGLGVATTTAAQLTPELGRVVQQYVTTAIPFNLAVQEIAIAQDDWDRPAHFIRTAWRD